MVQYDHVGYWSEVKLDIIREYATAYSRILAAQRNLQHVYIDGFAGTGEHIARGTGQLIPGSPLNALAVNPPFREYHLVDLDGDKIKYLKASVGDRDDVYLYHGDCNEVLLKDVFPRVQYRNYRRGLCLLDPYGLNLRWEVVREAGSMRTLDLFLNFQICGANRNALWRNPMAVSPAQAERMTLFWGDESWHQAAYRKERGLFGEEDQKNDNDVIAEAYRDRLKKVAGFGWVPPPMPMRNTRGAVVYYLYFASHKRVAEKIVRNIFDKHGDRRE